MNNKFRNLLLGLGLMLTFSATASCSGIMQKGKNDSVDSLSANQVSLQDNGQMPVQRASYSFAPQNVDFVDAAEKSVNAVVHIKTEIVQKSNSYNDFFGSFFEYLYGGQMPNNTMVAYGSGVVISPDGYIVTNNHVVEGADNVEVTFNNNTKKIATIIGTDPSSDLALIKVDERDLDYLVFGDSDKVRVGEWVLAVGNPFNLTSTVTAGIVSAKARNLSILGDGSTVESFIQTDAAVNRGNSGGALVNTNGELIGINAAIASHTGVYEGYSFAIPSNIVRKVVDDILMYGQTQRAYLGVQVAEMNEDLARSARMSEIRGIYVANVVEGSGAEAAGIKEGDVITAVNGNKIATFVHLTEIIRQFRPGDKVSVDIVRNGRSMTYEVELRNENGTTEVMHQDNGFYDNELGATLRSINNNEKQSTGLRQGLVVLDVKQGILQRAGVSKGFIITSVNNYSVNSQAELNKYMDQTRTGRVLVVGMYPNGMKLSFEFLR